MMGDLKQVFLEIYPQFHILSLEEINFGSTHRLYLVKVIPLDHSCEPTCDPTGLGDAQVKKRNLIWKFSNIEGSSLQFESQVYEQASEFLQKYLFQYIPAKKDQPLGSVLLEFESGFLSAWDLVMRGKVTLMDAFKEGLKLLKVFHQEPHTLVHQDFHFGQFGQTLSGRWVMFDFEGLPVQQEMGVECQWMDVAGLIRSLDYAQAVLNESDFVNHFDYSRIEFHKEESTEGSGFSALSLLEIQEFLKENYGLVFQRNSHLIVLMQMVIRRAKYEQEYEKLKRPLWEWIPKRGRLRELKRLSEIRRIGKA